jgi:hypothetical protein
MPFDRALYMAIGVAAQFELMLRQMDIIGEWAPPAPSARSPPASPPSIHRSLGRLLHLGEYCGLALAHEDVEVEVPRRAGFRSDALQPAAPAARWCRCGERTGAIVKGEHGLPVRYRAQLLQLVPGHRRAAGIPDDRLEHGRARRRRHRGG